MAAAGKTIVLFDVDGTLTAPRKRATAETIAFLRELRRHVAIGMVGGSDLVKQKEQLGDDVLGMFDYVFPENGLVAYSSGVEIGRISLREALGNARIRSFIDCVLAYIAALDIPVKRGTFVEFRNGMINVSPIGRNCNQEERDEFERYDAEHGIRSAMVAHLRSRFPDWELQYSIGGQISFDVFPKGWDKTYCLQYLTRDGFTDIHFFGDKVMPGGNDYEIYTSPLVKGHATTGPEHTERMCRELFFPAAAPGGAAAQ